MMGWQWHQHMQIICTSLQTDNHASTSLPAALREAQTCWYLVYSEADFEVFHPAGATRCTDGTKGPLLHAKFHPHRCNDKGVGPPKSGI